MAFSLALAKRTTGYAGAKRAYRDKKVNKKKVSELK